MKNYLISVINGNVYGYYDNIEELVKESCSLAYYGINVGVYQLQKDCKQVPYYFDNIALSINKNNYKEIYNLFVKNNK